MVSPEGKGVLGKIHPKKHISIGERHEKLGNYIFGAQYKTNKSVSEILCLDFLPVMGIAVGMAIENIIKNFSNDKPKH